LYFFRLDPYSFITTWADSSTLMLVSILISIVSNDPNLN
jgi:hypothetical protein